MPQIQFIIFLFFSFSTYAQFKVSTLKDASPFARETLNFPFIKSANTKAAGSINAWLQSKVLDNEKVLTNPHKVFLNSKYINSDSISQSGYSDLHYKVQMNTSRVLSIEFDIEATGAYSTYYSEYYSFNAETGKPVTTKAIFTAEGLKYLRRHLVKLRARRITQFLKEVSKEYNDTTGVKKSYDVCNQQADEDQIFVLPKSILFYKGFCFPHVERPYDTDLDITIPIAQIQKYLTNYGKKLLL
jgi:hypothetical protein